MVKEFLGVFGHGFMLNIVLSNVRSLAHCNSLVTWN